MKIETTEYLAEEGVPASMIVTIIPENDLETQFLRLLRNSKASVEYFNGDEGCGKEEEERIELNIF